MNTPNDGMYPGMNNGNGPHNGTGPSSGNGGFPPEQPNYGGAVPPSSQAARPAPPPMDLARLQRMAGDGEEKSNVNVLDYVWLLWRGKWIILTCLLIAGLGTAYYTFSLPFVYQSSLLITVNDQEEGYVPLFSTMYRNPARVLQKELQVLTSRPVLESTAKRLLEIHYLDTTGAFKDSVIPVIVATEKSLQTAFRGASEKEKEDKMIAHLASTVQHMTSAAPAKDADIIQVVTTAGDPREAALVSNVYAQMYIEENKNQNQAKTKATIEFLSGKMQSAEDSLRAKELLLERFQEETQMFDGAMDAASLSNMKRKFQEEITRGDISIAALQKELDQYKSRLLEIEPTFAAELAAATPLHISQMQGQIASLRTKRDLLITENPARASEVWYQRLRGDLDKSIVELQKRLDAAVEEYKNSKLGSVPQGTSGSPMGALTELKEQIFRLTMSLESARANKAATEEGLSKVEGQISQLPEQTRKMNQINREREALTNIYRTLSQDYNEKTIEIESLFSNARIIEPALPNFGPISPNRSGNITTGSIMGLAVGIGIVLLIAYTDSTVHSPDELEKNGFTVLSAIPLITENALSVANRQVAAFAETFPAKPAPHLITQIDMKSPIAESYRSLRTAVQFSAIEAQVRSILVTSSIPQEGKSTTSTNLAIVIAQSGARTLLVDCDLRRPVLHSVFGISKDPGLVNALVGTVPLEEAIHQTGIPNLDLLPSGSIPPNPSELLGSRRMRVVLEELKERYDTVILDSPPVGTVTDSVVLSTLVDSTIVIVRAHKTKMEFLEKTREALERITTNLIGVVLNDFDVAQSYGSTYRYYRYYKYYGYYSQNEDGPMSSQPSEKKKRSSKKSAKASA